MLPADHRLVEAERFRRTVRRGRRSGASTLVVHLDLIEESGPCLVGFVVSKAVGHAVVRNHVKRRLRHLTREHLDLLEALPGRAVLVVRALPAAGDATWAELGADLDRSLSKAVAGFAAAEDPVRMS